MGIYEGLGPRLKGARGLLSMSVLYSYYITSIMTLNHDMNHDKFKILDILVWLESSKFQLSKTFSRLKIS